MTKRQSNASTPSRKRFASRFWPSLAALVVVVVTVLMGRWQLDRAQTKEEHAARYDSQAKLDPVVIGARRLEAGALDYRRVSARGRWLTEYEIFVDNQVHQGQAGFDVYTPLRLEGGELCLLVNRGWVAAGRDRAQLPVIKTPAGSVELLGTVPLPARFAELAATYREGRIWQNVTPERFSAWSGLSLQPFVVRQTDDAADGLVRDWPRPDFGVERHHGYAFQWFALALLTCLLWGYYFFRRGSPHVE